MCPARDEIGGDVPAETRVRPTIKDACSAYDHGSGVCDNGFLQSPACYGAACFACGRPHERLPMCLRDEVPEHLVDERGYPTLTRHWRRP